MTIISSGTRLLTGNYPHPKHPVHRQAPSCPYQRAQRRASGFSPLLRGVQTPYECRRSFVPTAGRTIRGGRHSTDGMCPGLGGNNPKKAPIRRCTTAASSRPERYYTLYMTRLCLLWTPCSVRLTPARRCIIDVPYRSECTLPGLGRWRGGAFSLGVPLPVPALRNAAGLPPSDG